MKLFIKVIGGAGCVVDATADTTIVEIKKEVEGALKVPVGLQTLVYIGKTLVDDKTVGFYEKIEDGAKIHLLVKKLESLPIVLERFLRKYFNEQQAKEILAEFMADFTSKVKLLSLDDLEQIAINYMSEEAEK